MRGYILPGVFGETAPGACGAGSQSSGQTSMNAPLMKEGLIHAVALRLDLSGREEVWPPHQ